MSTCLAAKQSGSKAHGLFSVGSIAADGVSSQISDTDQQKQVLIGCWAQLRQDKLNQAIDQLPK